MKNSRPKFLKKIALLLAGIMWLEAIFPVVALALTSGPSQPEMQGFQPVGTTDMVDLFTGNFSYNIPLCDVDGYPLNLSYQSDPGMDQEASWVGLGWSLNPGVMNREVRGFPDDFKEEAVKKEFNMRPNVTVGVGTNAGLEFFGLFGIGPNFGLRYNNYRGLGSDISISAALNISGPNKGNGTTNSPTTEEAIQIGADLSFSSGGGLDIGTYASLGFRKESDKLTQATVRSSFNSRQGLKEFNYTSNLGINSPLAAIYGSGAITFSGFSYFPTSSLPLFNQSYALDLKGGGELFGVFPNLGVSGYYTEQRLTTNRQTQYAYGYLHLAAAKELPEEIAATKATLLDYNTERRGVIREEMPNLPLAYGTYDLFTATGQGISGQFRPVRNDVGLFHPAYQTNISASTQLGGELGAGFLFETGGRGAVAASTTTTQAWKQNNQMYPLLQFTEDDQLYESVFFKNTGEPTLTDPSFQNLLGADYTIHSQLSGPGNTVLARRTYAQQDQMKSKGMQAIDAPIKRTSRESRNQVFSYLTAEEASKVGLEQYIKYYNSEVVYTSGAAYDSTARTAYPDHHISEVNVLQSDGGRYVYGIPVYNHRQREVTFSVDAPDPSSSTFQQDSSDFGLVSYLPNQDNTVANQQGQDHFFDATEIPAYAHSYLLTAVLSPDYIDRTGDGITDDDIGNAVKFNYSRAHEDFKWRIPFQENKARYHEGYQSWDNDDKASYLYGEKEIWYLHSIESRTMVAHFYTSARLDGLGVVGENGGLDTQNSLEKLDSIRLYSKSDLIANDGSAVPIKTVHFEYFPQAEGLCNDIPNTSVANGGKLTLKKVYFTYGNNRRGQLNAYEFSYKESTAGGTPFDYNTLHTDRWGTYKRNPATYPRNDEFPYSLQDADSEPIHDYAAAWNLNHIKLPSGGEITVGYEADDYAYVQDKRAGQMFFIQGFANDTTSAGINNQLFTGPDQPKQYAVIGGIPSSIVNENRPLERYFKDVEKLYFKSRVDLNGQGQWDYVTGYLDFDRAGVFFHADRMYIPVEPTPIKGAGSIPFQLVHPISLAAFQLMRLELPHLVYDGYDLSNASVGKIIKSLLGFGVVKEVQRISKGFERQAMLDGQGKSVDLSHSWVRLSNPTYQKFGGGSRVKEIRMSDQWTGGGGASEYGQVYSYTKSKKLNGAELTISSGVAAYEPLMGGEENLMRNPLPYRDKVLLAPDNFYYTEAPIGETLFPAPTVGYSAVRVESIPYTGVSRTGTGYSISEFYTAQDFPVRVDMGRLNPVRNRPSPIERFFKIDIRDQLGMSQGFVIEVNDMHGKPRSSATFDHTGARLAQTDYHYRTTGENRNQLALNNTVQVIDADNTITDAEIGVDMEVWQEMMEETNETTNIGTDANLNAFLAFIFPVGVPTAIPVFQKERSQLRTSVTTKLIKRYGMLDQVTVMENGSTITTENILYDKATGSVLLTKTQNEFDDAMYQFNYPAHWAYEGMAQAYQNINGIFSDGTGITNGILQNPNGFDPLVDLMPGDEVVIQQDGASGIEAERYWVTKPGSDIVLMDRSGVPLTLNNPLTIKVIRSGRRNQAGAGIGSFTSRINPIDANTNTITTPANDAILESGALTFQDRWQMYCPDTVINGTYFPQLQGNINPYTEGLRGNWRPELSYIFYGDRGPSTLPVSNGQTNIREDGAIKNFAPFWVLNGTTDYWEPDIDNGWTKSDKITVFDQRGNEIENEDALGIPSGALFGYDQNRVVAIAGNARQSELAVDGFEDYDYQEYGIGQEPYRTIIFTNDPHTEITDQAAHTGKHSLLVGRSIDVVTFGDSCFYNLPPEVYLNNLSAYCDTDLMWSFSVNTSTTTDDQDINTLSYTWDFGDGSLGQSGTGLTSVNHTYSATGIYIITVTAEDDFGATDEATVSISIVDDLDDCVLTSAMALPAQTNTFTNQCADCLPKLRPWQGKPYWVSVWVAEDTSLLCGRPPVGALVTVTFTPEDGGSATEINLAPSGPVIEGWQKIEGKIDVPADYAKMTISLGNDNVGSTDIDLYYDDFRFHPWQSNMQSYVYDPVSMRLMATLDENNYANFYEYDDEGILVRVKRETEKGVMTVQETRTVMRKE